MLVFFLVRDTAINMAKSFGIYSFTRLGAGRWQVDLNMNWGSSYLSMCGVGSGGDNTIGIRDVSVVGIIKQELNFHHTI